ncbi:protein of unknown function [Clostridium beijerinckii]|nr:protein of unknown function [Clostridium beijerinckii]
MYKITQKNKFYKDLSNIKKEFRNLWRNYIILNIFKATGRGGVKCK